MFSSKTDVCLIYVSVSQGDYDPVKTRVLHLKMNPTAIAKQERQQEVEALREEVTRLRDLVRSLQSGGAVGHSQDDMHSLSLPPSKEVLGKIRQKWNVKKWKDKMWFNSKQGFKSTK